MKKFVYRCLFFAAVLSLTACGVQPGSALPTPTPQPKTDVIVSRPLEQPPTIAEGITYAGNGDTSDQVIKVDADGRYRVDWAIAAPYGGRVELINNDPTVDLLYRHLILSNMDQPSNGFFDVALTEGEYTLRVDVDGNWAFTFSLVQKMDL